jgi:hypothetical protein
MTTDWFKTKEMQEFTKRKDLQMLKTWRGMQEFLKHMARNPTLYSENEIIWGKTLTARMVHWYKSNPYANVDPKGTANGLVSMERIKALKGILMCFLGIDDHEMKECNTDWSRTWKLDG